MDKSVNILVLGKAGVGKSSFLNYLVDKDVFETGIGEPVTKTGFHETSYLDEKTGISFNLIDTAGIEPDNINSFKELIFNKIDDCNSDINVSNWMHTIYYCISASSKRVEPYEIELIKQLSKKIHVILILTKVDLVDDDLLNEIKSEIRLKVGNSIDICAVCNVQIETRLGQTVRFGKEEVLEYSFMGLWTTLSRELPTFTKSVFSGLTNTILSLLDMYIVNIELAFEFSLRGKMNHRSFEEQINRVNKNLKCLESAISNEIDNYLETRLPITIEFLFKHIDKSLDTSIDIYSSFMAKNSINVKKLILNISITKLTELINIIKKNTTNIVDYIPKKHESYVVINPNNCSAICNSITIRNNLRAIRNNLFDLLDRRVDIAIHTLEMEIKGYAEYVVRK